jgi:hypothetical protein
MGEGFGGAIQAQRGASRSDGVDGGLHAARLGVRAMGPGLAVANGLAPRHASTPVARLLSTPQRMREEGARCGVRFVSAERKARCVNCDGPACEDADQAMLVLGTQTEPGRRTPLGWQTGTHSELQGQRQAHEEELLGLLTAGRPKGVRGTVVAGRGFAASKRYRVLTALGVEDSLRFRRVVDVEAADGERRQARAWLGGGGRRRGLRGARLTAEGQPVPMVGCVPAHERQEPWLLASRRSALQGAAIKPLDGNRVTVEETFRDVQNPRLGLGRKQTVRERNDRRDARFLLAGLAHTLRTRLGKAGEALGMDRWLGATRPRPYAHCHQAQLLFDLIPPMARKRLRALLQRFGQLLRDHALLSQVLGYL